MWARRTKQGKKPTRRGKKSLCIFKSRVGQTGKGSGEAQRASELEKEIDSKNEIERNRERERERRKAKRGAFRAKLPLRRLSEMENGEGACVTTMGRVCTPENWPTQKKQRLCLGMRQKLFRKKNSDRPKGEELIGGHALTTLPPRHAGACSKGVAHLRTRQLRNDVSWEYQETRQYMLCDPRRVEFFWNIRLWIKISFGKHIAYFATRDRNVDYYVGLYSISPGAADQKRFDITHRLRDTTRRRRASIAGINRIQFSAGDKLEFMKWAWKAAAARARARASPSRVSSLAREESSRSPCHLSKYLPYPRDPLPNRN